MALEERNSQQLTRETLREELKALLTELSPEDDTEESVKP